MKEKRMNSLLPLIGKVLIIMTLLLGLTACEKEAVNTQQPITQDASEPVKDSTSGQGTMTEDEIASADENGCYDSDKGSFDKIKGYVKDKSGNTFNDECVNEFSVREYYCGDLGYKTDKIINCKYKCEDGACIEGEFETQCVDSDYHDEFTKGVVQYKGEVKTDYCDSDRTLVEYVCNSVDIAATDKIICEAGCSDGRCNPEVEVEQTSSCTDYDMGPDAQYEASRVKDPKGEFFDECLNPYTVKEYYCNSYGFKADKNINCPNGCVDGACVR